MTRRELLAVKLAVFAWSMLLLAIACGPTPTAGVQARTWQPLPTSAFTTWPVDPIRRPIWQTVPGSAGKQQTGDQPDGPSLGVTSFGLEPQPSTPPTSRPTGQLVPPIVATKGTAGVATWYDYHPGQAAAAARLRAALGPDWRGQLVLVCRAGACLRIRLTDYESSQVPGRLIDLDASDFRRLCGPLGLGVCAVTVTGE